MAFANVLSEVIDDTDVQERADGSPPDSDLLELATSFQEVRLKLPEELEDWWHSLPKDSGHAELFREMHQSNPKAAERLAEATLTMPQVGAEFLGFRLLAELGRGALGRVFLAQQGGLADRPVVLKISPDIDDELRNLAQLQHTNVVPIYSVHRSGPLQAVCMPYFGSTTLASVLGNLQGQASLPQTGKGLVSTLMDRKGQTKRLGASTSTAVESQAASRLETIVEDASNASSVPVPTVPTGPAPILEMLQGLSYVEAVLWIGARLADGLAHAHERGILHRDLKPANILLTDDGQPMLLDFNLAQDTKLSTSASAALVGGTLPFMAPEQLEAYREQTCVLTFTSDIYSLGVILYELLTGRHPFGVHTGGMKSVLDKMIADRRQPPPEVRRWNQAVSPAVESIVRHCLEPDPAKRYQAARDLQEDMTNQLEHLPLRHAPEPSLRERAGKWTRRHPRLTSSTSVAVLAMMIVVALVVSLVVRGREVARLEAAESLGRFLDDKKTIQFLITADTGDGKQHEHGMEECRRLLDSYRVLENDSWQDLPAVRHLPAPERTMLREQIGELLFLYAQAIAREARDQTDAARRADRLEFALQLNTRAQACQDVEQPSRALALQRAELQDLLGRSEEARTLRATAQELPLRTARDRYLLASEEMAKGHAKQALPYLREATAQAPQDFWAWFWLGACHDQLSQNADAVACYSTCIALWPHMPWAYYNRGLAHLRQMNYVQAKADFDQAINLRSDLPELYLQRSLAEQALKQYALAIEDLSMALELGAQPVRVHFLRAEARQRAGDAEGARRDRAAGLRTEPTDAQGWLARGFARMAGEPEAALEDFDKALQLEPRSLPCLQNKAHVLSRLNRNQEAVEVLNKAVEWYPDYVMARSGRAVLLARLGQREAAQRDAEECLRRDRQPLLIYQLAGVYALTAPQHPEDLSRALRFLASALVRGCGFDLLEQDKDLDPIRQEQGFQGLVAATKAIRATANKK